MPASTSPELIEYVLDELFLIAAKSIRDSPATLSKLLLVRPESSSSYSHQCAMRQVILPQLPWCSIDNASATGNTRALEWWLSSPATRRPTFTANYSNVALDSASAAGHVQVLDLWFASSLPLKYTAAAVDAASANGMVAVLDRWYERVHRPVSLDLAAPATPGDRCRSTSAERPGPPKPADERESGQLMYTENAMGLASKHGHLDVLQWWLHKHQSNGLLLKFTSHAINWACLNGHRSVVKWWKDNLDIGNLKFDLNFTGLALFAAVSNDPTGLELWQEFGLSPIVCAPMYISFAAEKGAVAVLDWWLRRSGTPIEYGHEAMDIASAYGQLDVLQWFAGSGLELKYTAVALDSAIRAQNDEVVSWWMESGLEVKSQIMSSKYLPSCAYL
ncbi:hypothetical protein BCR44DRAFT_1462417 [Catenaria anguillulae PL171]|uniref:Ankyrin repeat-containing domain protein n=1 Tax=Catenaria anguillulae PL171 TaxID=765915 RepID=A0A1Y2HG12_9FUNG|nr:hypothetical protein BCR44DRAFT_1462417 [Catenaria anguillulae PL171]